MLRNNSKKNTNNLKVFGRHLRTWVCHANLLNTQICLRGNDFLQFNAKKNVNNFKDFYSNLFANLVDRLPAANNIFDMNSVIEYYSVLNILLDCFKL